jgi:hypothetical protein
MKEPGSGFKEPEPGKERPTILELFQDGRAIDEAVRRGVREALLRHKKLGESIAAECDGEVVILPPEDIPA